MPEKIATSNEDFAAVYNDVQLFPSVEAVAQELDLSYQRVKNRASQMKARREAGDTSLPQLIDRGRRNNTAPAYDATKQFYPHWTEDDCIRELKRVQGLEPEKFLTRTQFRNQTIVTDSTWNRFFGTFQEFKRAAGLDLNRHQSQLEKHIASHSSVDHYREANRRHEWGNDYERKSGSRFQTMLLCSDLHDHDVDPFYLRVLLDTAKRAQPDTVVFVGDVFDLPEFGRYGVDPRSWDPVGRIKFVHEQIYRPLREACPDAQIDHIEGNHEHRLLRHLADATPALQTVLSDLHGLAIPDLLGIKQFEINYISKADLAARNKHAVAKEIGKSYRVYHDFFLAHHFPYAASWGMPGVNGHHHNHVCKTLFDPRTGPYEWHQMAAGHKRDAEYCEGEKWSNGFVLAHLDVEKKSAVIEHCEIRDHAVIGGKWYTRLPSEAV